MARALKVYLITAHRVAGLTLDQQQHVAQARYAVAATSRAAALRAYDAVRLHVTAGDFRDYGNETNDTARYPDLVAAADVVHYRELNKHDARYRPVPGQDARTGGQQ